MLRAVFVCVLLSLVGFVAAQGSFDANAQARFKGRPVLAHVYPAQMKAKQEGSGVDEIPLPPLEHGLTLEKAKEIRDNAQKEREQGKLKSEAKLKARLDKLEQVKEAAKKNPKLSEEERDELINKALDEYLEGVTADIESSSSAKLVPDEELPEEIRSEFENAKQLKTISAMARYIPGSYYSGTFSTKADVQGFVWRYDSYYSYLSGRVGCHTYASDHDADDDDEISIKCRYTVGIWAYIPMGGYPQIWVRFRVSQSRTTVTSSDEFGYSSGRTIWSSYHTLNYRGADDTYRLWYKRVDEDRDSSETFYTTNTGFNLHYQIPNWINPGGWIWFEVGNLANHFAHMNDITTDSHQYSELIIDEVLFQMNTEWQIV